MQNKARRALTRIAVSETHGKIGGLGSTESAVRPEAG